MIREPIVAGKFYPASKKELLSQIKNCEHNSLGIGNKTIEKKGKLLGFIAPHAGYFYSGPVATWSFRRLSLEKPLPTRFLLLGPKHTRFGSMAALSSADSWKTPLGNIAIEKELRSALYSTGFFELDDQAHEFEHSLEVQLPFFQNLFGSSPFEVVPLALNFASFETCRNWGKAIQGILSECRFSDVRVLVSSDFSHDSPRSEAYDLDAQAIDLIEKIEAENFYNLVCSENRSICGVIPITVYLESLRGTKVKGSRLSYSTSMDVSPHPRGVGYASIIFEEA